MGVDLKELERAMASFLLENPVNRVSPAAALRPELSGMPLLEEPVLAVGDAADPLFTVLKRPEVVGPQHRSPTEWLPEARRVIALFFPFTAQIKQANTADHSHACDEWRHGFVEGLTAARSGASALAERLQADGYPTLVPSLDQRYGRTLFSSDWSERHVGFICGLGTFGRTQNLITAKGVAGQLVSVVTAAALPVTVRPYHERYEYCLNCGQCARNCPISAIRPELPPDRAKDNPACQAHNASLEQIRLVGGQPLARRGCGKCQVAVPCMSGIPQRKPRDGVPNRCKRGNNMISTMKTIETRMTRFLCDSPGNRVPSELAIRPELAGMRIYDDPLFAVGDAADPLFTDLRRPEVLDPRCLLPDDWLPGAQRVISIFFPYTEQIRASNAGGSAASDEWLHGRIEGQTLIGGFTAELVHCLEQEGYRAVAPLLDARLAPARPLVMNWSERHAAFICGLGTFSMSRSLITARGCAGRLTSVITDAPLPVTVRPYHDRYEYCSRCGKCARNCPAHAIVPGPDLDRAKDHAPCRDLVEERSRRTWTVAGRPVVRYGCGKCQCGVPCTDRIPRRVQV